METLEARLMTFSFLGNPITDPSSVTYDVTGLVGLPGDISFKTIRAAVAEAFDSWAEVAPLNFIEVQSQTADLIFAQADLGIASGRYENGRVLFGKELWRLGGGSGPFGGGTNFLYVATHEIGHALGLGHEPNVPAIMTPIIQSVYGGLGSGFLYPDDVSGIQSLYGNGIGSVTPILNLPSLRAFSERGVVTTFDERTPISSYQPFVNYTGPLCLGYVNQVLEVTANNGHQKTFSIQGIEISSELLVPLSFREFQPYPGYFGPVDVVVVEGLTAFVAEGGHVKAFSSGLEVASFFTYNNYQGSVEFGAAEDRVVTLALDHVMIFDLSFNRLESYIRG